MSNAKRCLIPDDPHGRGINTHAKHVCWRRRDRGEHCSPAKILKETFLLSYFCVTKSTKSHLRGFSILLKIFFRVHELVARAMRGEYVRHLAKQKLAVLLLSATSYYHACEHITRKSRADSCTHCLHARIKGLAGVGVACALTGLSK